MSETLYVATDAHGVQRVPGPEITWRLPVGDESPVTERVGGLVLRRPVALLEVLDERIYRAESLDGGTPGRDGTLEVGRARLVAATAWDTEVATRFALDCAEHSEHDLEGIALPDGTPLSKVVADARQVLDRSAPEALQHLGYLARLGALRRLRRERTELDDLAFAVLQDDVARNLDAFEDQDYADLLPIIDSLLAAMEALRHHVAPHLIAGWEEALDQRDEHRGEEQSKPMRPPTALVTPFGALSIGSHTLRYEPSWVAAREAARHARLAAEDRGGDAAEAAEQSWQADHLEAMLTAPAGQQTPA